jgi:hypothetical protein
MPSPTSDAIFGAGLSGARLKPIRMLTRCDGVDTQARRAGPTPDG